MILVESQQSGSPLWRKEHRFFGTGPTGYWDRTGLEPIRNRVDRSRFLDPGSERNRIGLEPDLVLWLWLLNRSGLEPNPVFGGTGFWPPLPRPMSSSLMFIFNKSICTLLFHDLNVFTNQTISIKSCSFIFILSMWTNFVSLNDVNCYRQYKLIRTIKRLIVIQ